MIIGIDLRCLPGDGSPGAGVAHAARDLARHLVELGSVEGASHVEWHLFFGVKSAFDIEGLPKERIHFHHLKSLDGSALREAVRESPCEVLFVPGGAVAPGLSIPCIPWVHDVAIFRHPEWFPQNFFRRSLTTRLFRRGLGRAQRILCVSEFSKQELVRDLGIDPAQVTVTLQGGDIALGSTSGLDLLEAKRRARLRVAAMGVTSSYILWLGTLEPRKNVPFLLNAWKGARDSFVRPFDLVIGGRDGWKLGPIHRALEETAYPAAHASRLHRVQNMTDEDRRDLLLAAEMVVLPSLHEGFGIVALEAMQAGTAVMVSSAGAMPEVVGEAGIVLPPDDLAAWSRALSELANDDISRKSLAEQGKAHSQGLTWARAANIAFDALTRGQV